MQSALSSPVFRCLQRRASVWERNDLWCFVYHWPWSLLWNAIGWNSSVWVLHPTSLSPALSLLLSLPLCETRQEQGCLVRHAFLLLFFFSWCFACIWMIMAHIVPARVTDWTAWQWKCIQDSVCCRLLYVLSPFEHNFERICVRLFSKVKEGFVEFLTSVGIGCFYPDLMGIESDFCFDLWGNL